MAAVEMNKALFEELTAGDKPVLVDFWAPWCGYCRRIAPAYDKISEEREGEVIIAKVNTDIEPEVSDSQKIEVLPTLVMYRNGQAIGSVVAPMSKAAIDAFIDETLSK